MGHCEICGKETGDSAVVYQADPAGATTDRSKDRNLFGTTTTTTTVKKYANLRQYVGFCCRDCRKRGASPFVPLFLLTVVCSGLTAFCLWGGPWYDHLPFTPFFQGVKVLCVLGAICGVLVTPLCLVLTAVSLFSTRVGIEQALLTHLNAPKNNNGHVYLAKKEGETLRPL